MPTVSLFHTIQHSEFLNLFCIICSTGVRVIIFEFFLEEYRGGGHLGHDYNDMFDDVSDAGYLGYEFSSRMCLFLPIYTNRRCIHDFLAKQNPTRRMGTFRNLGCFPSSHVLLDIWKEQEEHLRS